MRKKGREGEARENKHVRRRDQQSGGGSGRGRGGTGPSSTKSGKARPEEDLYEIIGGQDAPLLLILDCVQDPHNLGAILRTADGAGVAAVVAPRDKSA